MFTRNDLAKLYCYGHGIEIGAYHNPISKYFTTANLSTQMTYLDKWDTATMKQMVDSDPNLKGKPIVSVDIVDDGQWLRKVMDNRYDFLMSSHQLEHVESPLTAIENHLRVVKPNGYVLYAIPDKRYTFDRDRNVTCYDHIYQDYLHATDSNYHYLNNLTHFDEYLFFVDRIDDPTQRLKLAEEKIKANQDIHFHVWDSDGLMEMVQKFQKQGRYEIDLFARAGHETFIVLKKL